MWIVNWLLRPWQRYKSWRAYKRRLLALRRRDPFIYK